MTSSRSDRQNSVMYDGFWFTWQPASKLWKVTVNKGDYICDVIPYKNEYHTEFDNPKKMYTVIADNYPGIGRLEQMVPGCDLEEYVNSVRLGRQ